MCGGTDHTPRTHSHWMWPQGGTWPHFHCACDLKCACNSKREHMATLELRLSLKEQSHSNGIVTQSRCRCSWATLELRLSLELRVSLELRLSLKEPSHSNTRSPISWESSTTLLLLLLVDIPLGPAATCNPATSCSCSRLANNPATSCSAASPGTLHL